MPSPAEHRTPTTPSLSGGGQGGGSLPRLRGRARVGALTLGLAIFFLAAQLPAFADWPTYHKDVARTGYDSTAPALSNSVNQQWAHTGLDQDVYAEPLVYGTMVLVATEGN